MLTNQNLLLFGIILDSEIPIPNSAFALTHAQILFPKLMPATTAANPVTTLRAT